MSSCKAFGIMGFIFSASECVSRRLEPSTILRIRFSLDVRMCIWGSLSARV
ncbi:hypothetical protein CASFOL_012132 [Castilleja foliolosa]|uniref:Uncharacterized protein n=1 Tax=Castilleja foliolosa TaxID=1961234 RepID=A0ABD3DTK9_9LAMI